MQPFSVAVLTALIPAFINMATASPVPEPSEVSLDLEKRYASGQCGIHVTQHTTPSGIEAIIYDDEAIIIGNIPTTNIINNNAVNIDSQLPFVIVVSEVVDGSDLNFAYAGDSWSTTGGRCSVGGWAGGVRQMDCGFAC